jgi:hypothetical protein
MSDDECLNDRCAEDRLNPTLNMMRMRQAKLCDDSRPSWTWCLAIAALVVGVLKLFGGP